jgi:peptide deformylase
MSKIYGVLCDGCGKSDVVSAEDQFYEDQVPRNKWISVYIYDENGDIEGKELNSCTAACLEVISKKLRGIDDSAVIPHTHTHDHEQ